MLKRITIPVARLERQFPRLLIDGAFEMKIGDDGPTVLCHEPGLYQLQGFEFHLASAEDDQTRTLVVSNRGAKLSHYEWRSPGQWYKIEQDDDVPPERLRGHPEVPIPGIHHGQQISDEREYPLQLTDHEKWEIEVEFRHRVYPELKVLWKEADEKGLTDPPKVQGTPNEQHGIGFIGVFLVAAFIPVCSFLYFHGRTILDWLRWAF